MRAILLVKDKEGLNEDRLQNSRYGLTGKPTLAQQGIAGSLSASFKAGQQVTVSNLRSLNDKLREAQKALDNANNNIDKTDQTQDKMDDAKDEVNRLLSTGLWEKLWNGTITPFEFYAGKYAEDTSNEAMAGEPGFPVQNIGEVISAPPIPRLQYWDPFAKFGTFPVLIHDSDEYAFVTDNSDYRTYLSHDNTQFNSMVRQVATFIGLGATALSLSIALQIVVAASPAIHGSGASYAAGLALSMVSMAAATSLILAAIEATCAAVLNGNINNFSGYNVSNWISSPTCYYAGKTHIISKLRDPGLTTFFLMNAINIGAYIGAVSTALGMIIHANVLYAVPFTMAAGIALAHAAAAVMAAAGIPLISIILGGVAAQLINLCDLQYSRRLINYSGSPPKALAEESGPNGKFTTLWYSFDKVLSGTSTEFAKAFIIAATSGFFATQSLKEYKDDTRHAPDVYLSYNHNLNNLSTEVTTTNNDRILTPFNGWWSAPIINVNINDVADGTIVGGPIQQPTFLSYVNTESRIRSQVFKGDYFGLQRGIKLLEGRTITNTVVVRAKLTANNYTYYGCGVLVTTNTTGNQLHLLWERNAIYDFSENTSMTHVEQMIYNYEPTALPVKDFFTNNRTGRLQYIYGKFRTGKGESTFQLRNVQKAWPNYLNGQLINTEYTFGPMTVLSSGPRCGWGDLSSYMYL